MIHNRKSTVSRSTRKAADKPASAAATALATCPVNGAGWCPYPFSPAQLAKRLKLKAEAVALAEAEPAKRRVPVHTH